MPPQKSPQSPRSLKLTQDDVARTALRILDELGLADLTMRRLASELAVQPSALYWHFADKQTLLAGVADRIVPLAPAPGDRPAGGGDPGGEDDGREDADAQGGWDDRLRAEAAALRTALLAHRDSAEVVSSTIALGLGANPSLLRLRRAFDGSEIDALTADRAASSMLHLVLGHVSLEQQRLQYERLGVRGVEDDAEGATRRPGSDEEDFRFGVEALIVGLRALAPGD